MARIITILNQKGGVGKTTTVMNLGGYLAMLGNRTLIVDFDPQFNATLGLGARYESNKTIYQALIGEVDITNVIVPTSLARLDIVPASQDLAGALVELLDFSDRNERLRNILNPIRSRYDFILIDLGPSLNMLTINGLLASDEVLIPVQCEYYSLEGIRQLLDTIELIHKNLHHPLKIAGALLTMYDKREKLSREVAREIRRRFPYHVYDVEIPRSVSLAESPSYQKPVMLYAPQSSGALAYEALAKEIVNTAEKTNIYEKEIDIKKQDEEKHFNQSLTTVSPPPTLRVVEEIKTISVPSYNNLYQSSDEPFLLINFSEEEEF